MEEGGATRRTRGPADRLVDYSTHEPRLQVDLVEEQQRTRPNAGLRLDTVVVGSFPFGSASTFSISLSFSSL